VYPPAKSSTDPRKEKAAHAKVAASTGDTTHEIHETANQKLADMAAHIGNRKWRLVARRPAPVTTDTHPHRAVARPMLLKDVWTSSSCVDGDRATVAAAHACEVNDLTYEQRDGSFSSLVMRARESNSYGSNGGGQGTAMTLHTSTSIGGMLQWRNPRIQIVVDEIDTSEWQINMLDVTLTACVSSCQPSSNPCIAALCSVQTCRWSMKQCAR